MEDHLFEIILKYGQKELSFSALQTTIEKETNRKISQFIVDEYWGYVEIEAVIKDLLDHEIPDWNQFELGKQVEIAIKKYENKEVDLKETQRKLETLTHEKVSEYTLNNYWRGEDLEELVKRISIKEIKNWKEIDDIKALQLISEILEKATDSSILKRNGNALERRYSKSEGTVMDLIFHKNSTKPTSILKQLKIDTEIEL